MRILIALTVTKGFHQSCGSIAEMKRHRIGGGLLNVLCNRDERGIDRVRLWSQREVSHGLRERKFAFGSAEKIVGVASRERDAERLWRGKPNVHDGHANNAASDVERIFSRSKHATKPVERRVHVAVAHAFVQRGNEIVVFFTGFVVEKHALLQRVSHDFGGYDGT